MATPPKVTILRKAQMYARLTAIVLIVSAVGAYLCSLWAYQHPYQDYPLDEVNYGLQVLGTLFIFIEIVMAVTLKNLHGGLYWFFWFQFKKVTPTPEEQRQRNRIFERSYGYAIALALIGFSVMATISGYGSVARDDLMGRLIWVIAIALMALPSITATIHPGKSEK